MRFTPEQLAAIERRDGDLLLDAGAGSGKTSVLVERFVRAVREDGVEVGRILAITFTEKAAAELRERIRGRLRSLGAHAQARETEGAFISTIHGFCARILRTHALDAGLDPSFTVLETHEAQELAAAAFDTALEEAARTSAGAELIAAHGAGVLRGGILAVHDELRSRGQLRPQLPPVALDPAGPADQVRAAAAAAAAEAARAAALELGALAEPGVRVTQALGALERVEQVLGAAELWPGDLEAIALPGRNGAAALKSDVCEEYRTALARLREAVTLDFAATARDALNALLVSFAEHYAALKRSRSGVDFEDLELLARELLAQPEVGAGYRERFSHVMVDELQDTNRVQLDLVDLVSGGGEVAGDPAGGGEGGSLFMVGDAQQSIYGFRHADVELFQERGRLLEAVGARASLLTNFRSRPEILTALNVAFASVLGDDFRPLRAGREDPPAPEPLAEMLVIDKGADWEDEGLAAPWRLAEARTLAARVRELIGSGACAPGDVVVLTRATTDLRAYERALEDAGVATYLIGGRGYWAHPQVVDTVSYLQALANPLDQEPWYATLVSPLCGLSLDGVVLVAAGARDELSEPDAQRLARFEPWFAAEREAAARLGVEELIERAMDFSGYDAAVLALPGGHRRLANIRKLMRLGREWEARAGVDLRGFLELVEQRRTGGGAGGGAAGGGGTGGGRESEAPVESEGLDAVRLMTIHRAKGLEFPVVCVADLGRGPTFRPDLIRIGRDGSRLGLRLARPGTAARIAGLDYEALGRERLAVDEAEERRLFYVAMTRAQERLILSGAAKMDTWEKGNRSTPIDWIAPAFAPDIASRVGQPTFVTDLGTRITFVSEEVMHPEREMAAVEASCPPAVVDPVAGPAPAPAPDPARAPAPDPPAPLSNPPSPPVQSLSYSSLALYERCGYRFYVERVLGLPPDERIGSSGGTADRPAMAATDRGSLVHAVLQDLDLRRPVPPSDLPAEAAVLVQAFVGSEIRSRLALAADLRREQRFAFPLGEVIVTGTFDAIAQESGGRTLIVDYKTDRLGGAEPTDVVAASYDTQRLVYALAALRSGAAQVEVAHLFLEAPGRPVSRLFSRQDTDRLEAALMERAGPLLAGDFQVTATPQRSICAGCPAAGGLCSWPLEVSMRPAADRLF